MKQALLWPFRSCWLAVICCAGFTVGCASGSWLESPSDAALPLDPPKQGYPTAVRASLSDEPEEKWQSRQTPDRTAAPAQPPQRLDKPSPPVPSLAVLPPQYVQRPPQPPTSQLAPPTPEVASTPPFGEHSLTSQLQSTAAALGTPDIVLPPVIAANQVAAQRPSTALPAAATPVTNPPAVPAPVQTAAAITKIVADSPEKEPQQRIDDARREFIESLEADIRKRRSDDPKDEELPRLEQELRLAYLASGRFEDAVAAVESLDEAQREAYKHLMFSLGVWLSPDESRRAPLRSAKVLRSLRDATSELAAASKLEVRNLAFCTDVDAFGWFREFPRNEFQPKQPVVLYVEVDNFAAEKKSPTSYETELQGRYQIYDTGGRIIAERQLEPDKAVCRNYRRDYFLRYIIYMPNDIAPGRYRLELIIEDLKAEAKYPGRKQGEGMIEFTIRQ